MIPLKLPNLPSAPVTLVVTAGDIRGINESIESLSIKALNVKTNDYLEPTIANHSDMLINYLGNGSIILSKEQTFLCEKLAELGIKSNYCNTEIISPYPKDVALNAARIGSFLICNPKTVAVEILENAKLNDLDIIPVNQGYTKCSICIINKNALITEDLGIKLACEKKGIDVLLIQKGSIKLKNKNYGFIGGCTGLIDKNKLGICGCLKNHIDYQKIAEFLEKYSVEPISLIDGDLEDIGGMIPLMQNDNV